MTSKSSLSGARLSVYPSRMPALVVLISIAATVSIWVSTSGFLAPSSPTSFQNVPINAQEILAQCRSLKASPGPSQDFHLRDVSDRYEPGTNATLIKNAIIFTGEKTGNVVIHGNILLDKGIVKSIGKVPRYLLDAVPNLTVVDANGAWVTPGLGKILSFFFSRPCADSLLALGSRSAFPSWCSECTRYIWFVLSTFYSAPVS